MNRKMIEQTERMGTEKVSRLLIRMACLRKIMNKVLKPKTADGSQT